jgi:hypothetical protein
MCSLSMWLHNETEGVDYVAELRGHNSALVMCGRDRRLRGGMEDKSAVERGALPSTEYLWS